MCPQLHEKYDPVFMVWLGTWWVLVLCGHAVVHEGLVDNAEAFAGRRHLPTLESTFHGHSARGHRRGHRRWDSNGGTLTVIGPL